jgi:SAM-dependent methyltransferase
LLVHAFSIDCEILMIIHKLILQHLKYARSLEYGTPEYWRHLRYGTDISFSLIQAKDAACWLERFSVKLNRATKVLDLGCGNGVFGAELSKKGCIVTFADEANYLLPEIANPAFRRINVDKEDVSVLGRFDLVICSNVFEHLSKPDRLIGRIDRLLTTHGKFYLSWTNWLSPWGGHEFSPFHYLGPHYGQLVYDKLVRRPRVNTPFENIFPTGVGSTLRMIRQNPNLRVLRVVPRYYTELSLITRIPVLREFLTWNCAILIERIDSDPGPQV